jgi:hypothetical protein
MLCKQPVPQKPGCCSTGGASATAATMTTCWSSRVRAAPLTPTVNQRTVDAALERDPEAAAAEWLAEFRSDIAQFVDRAIPPEIRRAGAGGRYGSHNI